MEVVRDRADNAIIICSIENVDPMGIHTGNSITVAPALTLTDKEYQIMRNASIAVPARNRRRNRRFQRPVRGQSEGRPARRDRDEPARVAAPRRSPRRRPASRSPRSRPSWRSATRSTRSRTTSPARRRPASSRRSTMSSPRSRASPSRSSRSAEALLSTAMKSVGEVMAIGRSFHESLQKALRGLETGLIGLDGVQGALRRAARSRSRRRWPCRRPDRLLVAAQALREGLHASRRSTRSPNTIPGSSSGSRRSSRPRSEICTRRPAARRRRGCGG